MSVATRTDRVSGLTVGILSEDPGFRPGKTVGPFDESAEDRTTFAAIQERHAAGKNFVAVQRPPTGEASSGTIVVVQNWILLFQNPRTR